MLQVGPMIILKFLSLLLNPTFAEKTETFSPVVAVDQAPGDLLLFLQDGRVGRVGAPSPLFPVILNAKKEKTPLEARLNAEGWAVEIRNIPPKRLPPRAKLPDQGSNPDTHLDSNPPSILTPTQAEEVFHSLNPNSRRRSQCFNRAHVWTFETRKFKGVHLMKVFMFFTAKYIRDYRYRWWFHVSPFAYVEKEGVVRESILDWTFMNGPTDPKDWSDHFIKSRTPCPTVQNYSDYSNHQYDHDCYFMKVPMYFWQPRHLEAREAGAPDPVDFLEEDVGAAYAQAFFGRPRNLLSGLKSQLGISVGKISSNLGSIRLGTESASGGDRDVALEPGVSLP